MAQPPFVTTHDPVIPQAPHQAGTCLRASTMHSRTLLPHVAYCQHTPAPHANDSDAHCVNLHQAVTAVLLRSLVCACCCDIPHILVGSAAGRWPCCWWGQAQTAIGVAAAAVSMHAYRQTAVSLARARGHHHHRHCFHRLRYAWRWQKHCLQALRRHGCRQPHQT